MQQVDRDAQVQAVEREQRAEPAQRGRSRRRHLRIELQHEHGEIQRRRAHRRRSRSSACGDSASARTDHTSPSCAAPDVADSCLRYTFRRMPFDVAAEVIANTRLSPDYNVLALAAPEIARAAAPGTVRHGQAAAGPRSAAAAAVLDLRDPARRDGRAARPQPAQQARRRRHVAALRREAGRSHRRASARSASRSCRSIRRPRPGWSPAASAWRRSRRWPKRWPRAARR